MASACGRATVQPYRSAKIRRTPWSVPNRSGPHFTVCGSPVKKANWISAVMPARNGKPVNDRQVTLGGCTACAVQAGGASDVFSWSLALAPTSDLAIPSYQAASAPLLPGCPKPFAHASINSLPFCSRKFSPLHNPIGVVGRPRSATPAIGRKPRMSQQLAIVKALHSVATLRTL